MELPSTVKIVEVGPRDGLQNETQLLLQDAKVDFINRLSSTGLSVIETGSLVSPSWVPQMADSDLVFEKIKKLPHVSYPMLVPNMEGMNRALRAGVKEIALFTAASETFNQKNINCSIEESFVRFHPIVEMAKQNDIKVRGYVSCVLGCPYEGDVAVDAVASVTKKLINMGCYEVSLGDTIGVGTPQEVETLIKVLTQSVAPKKLAVHFHDTYGQALPNILTALQNGISIIDSSVAGLGGCPYAKGATGNVATEDVVYMLNGLGIENQIDLNKLVAVGRFICEKLGIQARSKVSIAWP